MVSSASAGEDVLVERLHLAELDGVGGWVEVVDVAEQEAQGVAQLAVVVADALHQVFAGGYVFAEVDAGYPEADDLAAEALGDVDRIDAVAERFGEGAALLVEGPAGGGDHLVRGLAADGYGGEQGRVEPAAVLVSALGVEVGGEVEFGLEVEDGVPACAGLEPDVEDVHLLAELFVAAGAGCAFGQEGGCVVDVPGVGAFFFEEIDDAVVDGLIVERLVALLAEEDSDGDAPDALAGDAPVGAGGDHVGDALLAPGGIPDDCGDLVEGALAEGGLGAVGFGEHRGFHADEPLLGGADDDGVVAAPAVRVGVLEAGGAEEGSFFAQEFDDDGVGLEDGEVFVGLAAPPP